MLDKSYVSGCRFGGILFYFEKELYQRQKAKSFLDKSFVFCYDDIGNLTNVITYAYAAPDGVLGHPISIQAFTYDVDKLTALGSKAITYNANGEMTSFDDWTYSWSKGKLSSIRKLITSNARAIGKPNLPSSQTYSFVYNAFGQRTGANYSYFVSPTSSTNVSLGETLSYAKKFYYDHAGRLMFETKSTNLQGAGEENYKIAYLYDESSMIGMEYTKNNQSTLYYFQRNLQGDVIGIYDTNGNLKVRYIYDAWGNCTIDSSTADMELAKLNPIRYRGYYYDRDTGLYYLNARYYSPELRRFISPDDTAYLNPGNANGLNLYAYCYNDPVNYADPSGHLITAAVWIGLGIGAVLGGIYGGVSAMANGQNAWAGIAIGAVVGGLTGLFTEAFSIPGILLSTFAVGAGGDVASQLILDKKSWSEVNLISAVCAGIFNAGLALVGKGLSIVGFQAGLNVAESITFGLITNSPILALGMTFNMIISMYSPIYAVGNIGTEVFGKQFN